MSRDLLSPFPTSDSADSLAAALCNFVSPLGATFRQLRLDTPRHSDVRRAELVSPRLAGATACASPLVTTIMLIMNMFVMCYSCITTIIMKL